MKQINIFKHFGRIHSISVIAILAITSFIIFSRVLNINTQAIDSLCLAGIWLLAFVLGVNRLILQYLPLKKLTYYLESLSKGYITEFEARDLKLAPQFRYANRISLRYNFLNDNVNQLVHSTNKEFSSHQSNFDVTKGTVERLTGHLSKLKDEEVQWKEEEKIRTWTNQGIARFSELLRQNNLSFNENAQIILRELIHYVEANQGGIFTLKEYEENENYFEMVAAYAYERDKITDKKIRMGEGLYGAACFEKQTIFMTEIPNDYMQISSGMGGAQPKSLIIVPLLHDEQFLGIVELASFTILKPHEIEFIEKIANMLASTLSVDQMSETTNSLLQQSQKQTNELAQQEEELRQNMEEMQAQQEEMQVNKIELEESEKLMRNIIDLVPFPIFVKNIQRQYIMANQEQARLFNLPVKNLLGKSDDQLIHKTEELMAIRNTDDKVLKDNELIKLPEQSISLADGTQRILQTIKVPFVNNVSGNRNILGVSIDFTMQRHVENELNRSKAKIEQLKAQLNKVVS